MIHIATVHFNSGRWIEIQRKYLDRFIGEEFRVYGSLEGVPQEFERFFDVVVPSHGPHAGKLNLLGARGPRGGPPRRSDLLPRR